VAEVRKAVIPAAGLGTRFLPASKSVPKELLPLVDRPMIHFAVEEAVQAGIRQVIIVTSRGKGALEDYFDRAPELEQLLAQRGDRERLEEMHSIAEMADIHYVRQQEQLGLGHAILTARRAVGDEPFAVLLPDDVIVAQRSVLQQLLGAFTERQSSVIAVQPVPKRQVSAYGIVGVEPAEGRLSRITHLVEKPSPQTAPSNLGIVGRYVLTPEVFPALEGTARGAIGEIQLTDGIALLLQQQPVYAYRLRGTRYDVGNPLGMLQASIALALERPDLGPPLRAWLRKLG